MFSNVCIGDKIKIEWKRESLSQVGQVFEVMQNGDFSVYVREDAKFTMSHEFHKDGSPVECDFIPKPMLPTAIGIVV